MKITKKLLSIPFVIALLVLAAACAQSAPALSPTSAPSANQGTVSTPTVSTLNNSTAAQVTEGEISLDRNFYIIVDGSGSMSSSACAAGYKNRVEAAQWATTKFVSDVVPPDVGLGLLIFDSRGTYERVRIGKNNRDQILKEVAKMEGGGGTPLSDSLVTATKALVKQRVKQLGYGEFYIVVATDGEANVDEGVRYALKNDIPIITIGFCLQATHQLAKHSVSYRSAENPQQLFEALKETQAESSYFDSTKFNGKK